MLISVGEFHNSSVLVGLLSVVPPVEGVSGREGSALARLQR